MGAVLFKFPAVHVGILIIIEPTPLSRELKFHERLERSGEGTHLRPNGSDVVPTAHCGDFY